MKNLIHLFVFLMSVGTAIGQSVLDEYLQQGIESNLALQQEEQMIQKAHENLKLAKGLFHPTLSFNTSYMLAAGGRTIDIPIGDLLNPAFNTLNQLTDAQNFPTNLENASEPIFLNNFHDTRFEVRQPLFDTDIYFNFKAKSLLISVQEAQKATYVQELKKEIRKGYYNYLQVVEVLHIYDSTETVLKELVRINKAFVKNDKATKDVVFRAELELSELYSQRAKAEQQKHLAQSYFNFLLNRDLQSPIIIDSKIQVNNNANPSQVSQLQMEATRQRSELSQLKYAISANEIVLKKEEYNWLPKLSVGGALGFQGTGYQFNGQQDYGLIQFNLSIPILNGKRNQTKRSLAKIEVAQLNTQYEELEERIKVQVVDAYYSLDAANSIVQSKQAAFSNAQENFRIIKRKYEENLVLLVEFLDARVQFTNAEIDLVIANYDVLIKQAELTRVLAL